MGKIVTEAFVGPEVSQDNYAVAIANTGRLGEVRSYGLIASTDAAIHQLVVKLSKKHSHLTFCYEEGPTGYSTMDQKINITNL